MLDSLAALKRRVKEQIASARRQGPESERVMDLSAEKTKRQQLEERIECDEEERRQRILKEIEAAEKILPSAAVDDATARAVDNQLTDSWARIVSEFKRQLDNSEDLRILLADDTLLDGQEKDHPTVKFFKGVLSEWRLRLFALSDDELRQRKPELTTMWYCVFALQPFFEGLNEHNLSRDISIETGKIVEALKDLNYKEALNHYNSLAIGNSLWPIGVTNYSIHWKFSCDLIDSDRILHIFNNAPARNAIISIKRLMTKHQEFHNVAKAF